MPYNGSALPHRVVTIAYDRLWPLEFGIAAEIFGWERPHLGVDWYDFRVAAPSGTNRAMGGFSISAEHGLEITEDADTIIIPGWRDVEDTPPDDLLDALTAAHARGAASSPIAPAPSSWPMRACSTDARPQPTGLT